MPIGGKCGEREVSRSKPSDQLVIVTGCCDVNGICDSGSGGGVGDDDGDDGGDDDDGDDGNDGNGLQGGPTTE